MDDTLRCYIVGMMKDKTEQALHELNRTIDSDMPDDKVKSAAMEYARRKRMEDAFDSYLEITI